MAEEFIEKIFFDDWQKFAGNVSTFKHWSAFFREAMVRVLDKKIARVMFSIQESFEKEVKDLNAFFGHFAVSDAKEDNARMLVAATWIFYKCKEYDRMDCFEKIIRLLEILPDKRHKLCGIFTGSVLENNERKALEKLLPLQTNIQKVFNDCKQYVCSS